MSLFQTNLGLLIGRVFTVIGLIPNGLRKIADFEMTSAMMGGAPPVTIDGRIFPQQVPLFYFPFPEVFLAFAASFDILGALLLIVGVRTRSIALLLLGYCIIAIVIYHGNIGGPNDVRAILRNLPLVGGLLLLAGAGAGGWSIDGWLSRRPNRP